MSLARVRVLILLGCGLAVALLWLLELEPDSVDVPLDHPEAAAPRILRSGGSSRVEQVALGRLFTIEAEGQDARTDAALTDAAQHVDELDARLSEWRPGSDVWQINARAGHDPVEVHQDTRGLLRAAVSLSTATDGLYEPTLGAVRVLWPFGAPGRPLPLRADLDRALRLVDASRLNVESRTAHLPEEGMRLALDGLEVAFVAGAAMALLEVHGIRSAVVRAGRDVFTRGEGEGELRTVVVANPRWPGRTVERFTVRDRAAATIDDVHGALVHEGRVIPPVLDPRSGEPALGCRSVTVVADDPLLARAHATAIFILGPDRGLAWAEQRPEIATLIVDTDGRAHRSGGWDEVALPVDGPTVAVVQAPPHQQEDSGPSRSSRNVRPSARPSRDGVVVPGDAETGAFRLDRTEVTNAAYRQFLEAERAEPHAFCHPDEPEGHDHTPRYYRPFSPRLTRSGFAGALAPFDHRTFRDPDKPVVGVAFWDAWAFARWSGKRLPNRREFERACRGRDGRIWPFGDIWDPRAVNSGGERDGERDGHTYAAPADSFPAGASPEGCLHLSGNVAEWTEDEWVVGGSSRSNASGVACGAGRPREPSFRAFDVGFRCAAGTRSDEGGAR